MVQSQILAPQDHAAPVIDLQERVLHDVRYEHVVLHVDCLQVELVVCDPVLLLRHTVEEVLEALGLVRSPGLWQPVCV